MTKRREFIKNSVLGLAATTTAGSFGIAVKCCKPAPRFETQRQLKKNWQEDPEWKKMKYGDWAGPGVSSTPGPMDEILLKDYAPRSSVTIQETFVEKAKFPCFDSHVHIEAKTPQEIDQWVRTMDKVGIETSLILTGASGDDFKKLVESFAKAHPGRFQLYCGMDLTDTELPVDVTVEECWDVVARSEKTRKHCYMGCGSAHDGIAAIVLNMAFAGKHKQKWKSLSSPWIRTCISNNGH